MSDPEPSVLHVLPHPGGGGETYVNQLAKMDGYRFDKTFVASSTTPSFAAVVGGVHAQVFGRRFDLLHVQGEVAAGLCLPTLAFRPSVVTIHGLHLVRRLEGLRKSSAVGNLRLIARAASKTICVGDAEFAEVESLIGSAERLVLIRNGVDLPPPTTADERTKARAVLGLPATATVGLYLAALDPHKEPIGVAKAAAVVAGTGLPLVLVFAGDGPLRSELETLAGESTALKILGFQSDTRRVFAAADFFVLPSRREGLSFSLLEAMSAGLAPIVSNAPGNPDAVGPAGIIVRDNDTEGFRAAFERLALDSVERDRLGMLARERVAERFTSVRMIEQTRDVYNEVLASAR